MDKGLQTRITGHGRRFVLFTTFAIFFEIGMPNSILGTAWPEIRAEMGLPLEYIGILNIAVLTSSMIACILSGTIIPRFGTSRVMPIAAIIYIISMMGVTAQTTFIGLFLILIPVGYSNGTMDSGTNLYAAQHFESRNMNILHCVWGVGALMGPLLLIAVTSAGLGWRWCFFVIGVIGIVPLGFIIRSTLKKLWDSQPGLAEIEADQSVFFKNRLSGAGDQSLAVMYFFFLGGGGSTIASLLSSYMNSMWGTGIKTAGIAITFYLAALTTGRMIAGIIVKRSGNLLMIRIGMVLVFIGAVAAFIASSPGMYMLAVAVIGLGGGPLFPCMVHETSHRFTDKAAGKLVGYQVAASMLGGSLISLAVAAYLSATTMRPMMLIVSVFYLLGLIVNEVIVMRGRSVKHVA